MGQDYKFHPNEMLGATGKGLPYGVPVLQHRDTDAAGGSGYRVQLEDGHLWVYLAHSRPANMIALRVLQPPPVKEWTHITVTYDGSSRAAGTRVYLNGAPAAVDVDHDTLTRSILPFGGGGGAGDNPPGVAFGSRFREKAPVGSGIDEIRLFKRALSDLEVAFLQADAAPTPALSAAKEAVVDYLVATDPEVTQAAAALSAAREAHNKLVMVVPQVLVMRDAPKPRQAYLLNRGVYSERGEPVYPRGIERIFPWDEHPAAKPAGPREMAVRSQAPADRARLRQSHVADAFRAGPGRDVGELRHAGVDSHPSGTARLARRSASSSRDGTSSACTGRSSMSGPIASGRKGVTCCRSATRVTSC